jgi:hypothetical protein
MDESLENTNKKMSSSKENENHDKIENGILKELNTLEEELKQEDDYSIDDGFIKEEVTDTQEDFEEFAINCEKCGNQLLNGECPYCFEESEEEIPLEDEEETDEEIESHWRKEMRKKGELNIFGIFCVVVAAVYVIYISIPELVPVLTGEFALDHFAFYFLLLIIGMGALFGGLVMARHSIIYGRLFDTTFEKEIYSRLEPAFAEVGNIRGDILELHDKMERMNLHLERIERRAVTTDYSGIPTIARGSSLRYIFLMILTLGVFLFVLRYPADYVPYALTALFLVWWAGITSDYKLWKISVAWSWAFFALVVVPIASMLIHIIYGIGMVIGIVGIALTLYSFSYYAWAKYYVEGYSPDMLSFLGEKE